MSSCKSIEEDTSEILESPPRNLNRTTGCDLAPLAESARQTVFRGRTIRYYSSAEINYGSADWWAQGKPWLSYDALDSSVLQYPGFPGTTAAFAAKAPVNLRLVAVDIRNINGTLHYHYFSNETANSPLENWSSTKSLVMLQAAHTIRRETGSSFLSRVYSAEQGGSSSGWIGDHVNEVARTSNNGVAAWFKSITGSQQSQNFVRNWLGSSGTFGGLHGENPRGLGRFVRPNDQGPRQRLSRAETWQSNGSSNTLMPIIMAEFWKRLAVNTRDKRTWLKATDYTSRETPVSERGNLYFSDSSNFGVVDEDLRVLLYGYANSNTNGGLLLGATLQDEFVNAFGGKARLDRLSGGNWRLFGKTGSGFSTVRSRNEAAFGGFFCLPADPTRRDLPEGRLLAFFINSQAIGGASGPRQTALANLAGVMIPQLTGASNVWGPLPQPADDVRAGTAQTSVATILKRAPRQSAELAPNERCNIGAGVELAYSDRSEAAGNHQRLLIDQAPAACPGFSGEVFVFAPHLTFSE
jgi:hypothetical protein